MARVNTTDQIYPIPESKVHTIQERSVVSTVYDLTLICCPLWLPIALLSLFYFLPEYSALIYLGTLLVFAETHFGATWLFFLNSHNRDWLLKNKLLLIVIPLGIIIACLIIANAYSIATLFFLSSIASAFHVTRQSVGVCKLYSPKSEPLGKVCFLSVYGASAYFLAVGFIRFFTPWATPVIEMTLQIAGLGVVIICALVIWFKMAEKAQIRIKLLLVTVTGMVIYLPHSFCERIEIASLIGVGMHWIQYVALVSPLYLRRSPFVAPEVQSPSHSSPSHRIGWGYSSLLVFLLGYAIIMVGLRQWGLGFNTFEYSPLFLIPLTLQILHYYYEAFIWRFSDPHIRKQVGAYLFTRQQ